VADARRGDWWSANAGSREAAEHRHAVRGKHHGKSDHSSVMPSAEIAPRSPLSFRS
jgi:hypothetical protein